MNPKRRILFAQKICKCFPPIISQKIRDFIFPIELAREYKIDFKKKSITGSYLNSNTLDFHGYRFYIHGFFDWRNVIISNSIAKHAIGDIIEIGANMGTETVSFCDIVTNDAKVHAFEPLPKNLKHLRELSKTQKSLNVFEYAISEKKGEASFLVPTETSSGTGKIINNQEGSDFIRVKTAKLDDFLDAFNNVNFISIDTEGHEPFVLRGAKNTLKKYSPVVVIEVSPKLLLKYADSKPKDISQFFEDLGYNIFKINKFSISKITKDDLLVNKSSNWLCIPMKKKKLELQIKRDLIIRTFIPWYLLKTLPNSSNRRKSS
ncbi:FkbM family methyltransferase [Dokdonia ponticola]|uniref:FkbM family methyltransferase n=1 Tax=Dokdonia ponticola TaxID=2041041 RepID=A0ABV9I2X4_9FLAO